MKISKTLLLISSLILLAGCNKPAPIKPDTSGSSTSYYPESSMPDITSDYSSIYAGISKYELELIFEEAKTSILNLTGSNTSGLIATAKKNSNDERFIENHSISIKQTLYENSVLVTSYTSNNNDEFKYFGYYDETYGNLMNSYVFLDITNVKIEVRDVFKKPNEGVSNVKKNVEVDYTPSNYENFFSVSSSSSILGYSVSTDQVVMAGKFDSNSVYVRFFAYEGEGTHQIEDEFGIHKSKIKVYEDFLIVGNQLTKYSYVSEEFIMVGQDNLTRVDVEDVVFVTKYETSSKGKYNLSNIPEVTITD